MTPRFRQFLRRVLAGLTGFSSSSGREFGLRIGPVEVVQSTRNGCAVVPQCAASHRGRPDGWSGTLAARGRYRNAAHRRPAPPAADSTRRSPSVLPSRRASSRMRAGLTTRSRPTLRPVAAPPGDRRQRHPQARTSGRPHDRHPFSKTLKLSTLVSYRRAPSVRGRSTVTSERDQYQNLCGNSVA